jgi:hypothetical protein
MPHVPTILVLKYKNKIKKSWGALNLLYVVVLFKLGIIELTMVDTVS